MAAFIALLLFLYPIGSKPIDVDKKKFCSELDCNEESNLTVCGIRAEGQGFRLRLFENECELLNYGCQVEKSKAYGIINVEYCQNSLKSDLSEMSQDIVRNEQKKQVCKVFCTPTVAKVCAIRNNGTGFIIQLFRNDCELQKHNCETGLNFQPTDKNVCSGFNIFKDDNETDLRNANISNTTSSKHLIVVDGSDFNMDNNININESIRDFFAATHVFDLPIEDVSRKLNESLRRMLITNAGPVKVFKPWIVIPENKSEDYYHRPTLSSCFHKCPKKCPDVYLPVCGYPGERAREPALAFKNHCFMDAAQCKVFWKTQNSTSQTIASYTEAGFIFCIGEDLFKMFRFIPVLRTLQHMGRLKKGYFRHKIRNLRFHNNILNKQVNLMG